jgi:hypothetical protein
MVAPSDGLAGSYRGPSKPDKICGRIALLLDAGLVVETYFRAASGEAVSRRVGQLLPRPLSVAKRTPRAIAVAAANDPQPISGLSL